MIRHILTVSTGTLASRTLGFTRDALIAALLGAGPIADAFLVAFQFINVTRRSFTEGALNAALVPDYLKVRETEGHGGRSAFAGRVLGSVSLLLIVIALLLGLLMPLVISLLAPGFIGHETLRHAVNDGPADDAVFRFCRTVHRHDRRAERGASLHAHRDLAGDLQSDHDRGARRAAGVAARSAVLGHRNRGRGSVSPAACKC